MHRLYGIYDTVAQAIIGPLFIHAHPTAAIRMFIDVLKDKQTNIGRHPNDHELRDYGGLSDDHTTIEKQTLVSEVILTGSAWLATAEVKPEIKLEA